MSKAPKIPYMDTKISPEQSKADIEKLLKTHGIKDIQWTSYHGETTLKFIFAVNVQGVHKEIAFSFIPPAIMKNIRQYNPKTFRTETLRVNYEPASYRLLFWYLEAKLKAIEYGLQSVEREFMSQIMLMLPNGRETTIGERVTETMTLLQKYPALEESEKKEAPGPVVIGPSQKVIDIETEEETQP